MKQSWQETNRSYREQTDGMVMHFINGFMQMDEKTSVASSVSFYMATIHSDEYIGEIKDSDVMIGYNDDS